MMVTNWGKAMQPTRNLWQSAADLVAADTALLAAATAVHVHLSKKSFSPSLDNVLADFDEATFIGSTAANVGTGTQPAYYDVATGLYTIDLKSPVGGFKWICTFDPTVPEVIYGIYLTDTANAVLLGSQLLDQPVTIQNAGQGLDVGPIQLRWLFNSPY
jgi:hypothetical protein